MVVSCCPRSAEAPGPLVQALQVSPVQAAGAILSHLSHGCCGQAGARAARHLAASSGWWPPVIAPAHGAPCRLRVWVWWVCGGCWAEPVAGDGGKGCGRPVPWCPVGRVEGGPGRCLLPAPPPWRRPPRSLPARVPQAVNTSYTFSCLTVTIKVKYLKRWVCS